MDAPPVQFVQTTDGYSIAYATSGSGPPFVEMPGAFSHLQLHWQLNSVHAQWLAQLAKHYTVIEYDSRGQGMSQRGLPDDLSVHAFERDLNAVVEKVRPSPFVLFAQTMLARAAIRYTVAHPEQVRVLVLWNATVHGPSLWGRLLDLAQDNWDVFLETAARALFNFERVSTAKQLLKESWTKPDLIKRNAVLDADNIEDVAPYLVTPTLLLNFSDGTWSAGAESQGKQLASRIPNARLLLMNDESGGLYSRDSEPQAMRAIAEFIESLPSDKVGSPSSLGPHSLSTRELDVLRLIATGMTNPQIAGELVISRSTVQNHVSSILNKAGLANRAEAVAYAMRHGLA